MALLTASRQISPRASQASRQTGPGIGAFSSMLSARLPGLARRSCLALPMPASPRTAMPASRPSPRIGKPVVRVGPDVRLFRVNASRSDVLGKLGKLMTAPLTDSGERYRVSGQAQRDLIRLARAVAAVDGHDREHRPIYAA